VERSILRWLHKRREKSNGWIFGFRLADRFPPYTIRRYPTEQFSGDRSLSRPYLTALS
jgi:hypothetical protein